MILAFKVKQSCELERLSVLHHNQKIFKEQNFL